ncbi:MAG: hypothetical protein E7428_10300 [Ruminococcaceae bacterium]|nr:hypothetical protein [Oscillospiraceae bacterium]
MKHLTKIAAALTALSLMVCGFTGCANMLPTEEDIMPPPISKPEEASYKTEVVVKGDIQDTKYCVGAVTSKQTVTMAFQLDSGTFYKFYVEKGALVKKGDLLAEAENTTIAEKVEALEESMYRAKLQNDYTLNKLAQSLKNTKKGVNNQKSSLDALKSEKAALETELKKLEGELKLLADDLEAKKNLTLEDLDATGVPYTQEQIDFLVADAENVYAAKLEEVNTCKADLNVAKANVTAAEENYNSAKENLSIEQQYYDMQKEFISMDLANNNETLSELKRQLKETQIFAPFDGKITYLASLEMGAPINVDVPVLSMADPDALRFEYTIKESDPEDFEDQFFSGRKIIVNFTGIDGDVEGEVVQGTADVPEEALDSDEKATTVYVELKNVPEKVSMGTTGGMNIVIEEKNNVIVVDSALLQYTGGETNRSYYCYVLEDGLPTMRNVSVGIVTNAKIEVTEGLEEGEEIVTNYHY